MTGLNKTFVNIKIIITFELQKQFFDMKMKILLLMFACLSICSPPVQVSARDVGYSKVKQQPKTDVYAIVALVPCDNAASVFIIENTAQGQVAPTKEVGNLTKTPTVEVKAKATVAALRYQRLRGVKYNLNNDNYFSARNVYRSAILHIDPGLRGC